MGEIYIWAFGGMTMTFSRFPHTRSQTILTRLLICRRYNYTVVKFMLKLNTGSKDQNCILVVDDHEQVRCLLKEWLETVFPDYGVVEAGSGEEAVVVAQAKLPKLVIMDIGLPKMDGIRAAQLIIESVPAAKVVILTMHEEEQYKKDAFASGVNAYIPKRLMQSDLLPTLTRLIATTNSNGI
jgi:CheY-like chemotaxis protein